jgi:hypothetical protein
VPGTNLRLLIFFIDNLSNVSENTIRLWHQQSTKTAKPVF